MRYALGTCVIVIELGRLIYKTSGEENDKKK